MFGAVPAVGLARYTSSSRAAAINSEGIVDVQPSSPKGVGTPASLLCDQKEIWWGWRFNDAGGGEAGAEGPVGCGTET